MLSLFLVSTSVLSTLAAQVDRLGLQEISIATNLTNRTIDVSLHIETTSTKAIECKFELPNEITPLSNWKASSLVSSLRLQKKKDQSGMLITNTSFSVKPQSTPNTKSTKESTDLSLKRADVSYSISIGNQFKSAHLDNTGPRYGLMNERGAVYPIKLVTPICSIDSDIFTIRSKQDYPSLRPKQAAYWPSPISRSTLIWPSHMNQVKVHFGNRHILLHSKRTIPPETQLLISRALTSLGPLISQANFIPDLIDLEDQNPLISFHPLLSKHYVALDLLPMSPERLLRLLRVLSTQITLNHLSDEQQMRGSELWLLHALPAYYAFRSAGKLGALNFDHFLFDKRQDYDSLNRQFDSLSNLYRNDDVNLRELSATSQGLLVLDDLEKQLQKAGSSLDTIVSRTKVNGLWNTFKHNILFTLGPFAGWEWWNKNIIAITPSFASSSPFSLQPITLPIQHDAKMLIGVTSGLNGNLEMCGCKLSQAGGAAKRAQAMSVLYDNKTKIDLGHFSPKLTSTNADSESQILENKLFYDLMADMKYNVITLGPRDVSQLDGSMIQNLYPFLIANSSSRIPLYKDLDIAGVPTRIISWNDALTPTKYVNYRPGFSPSKNENEINQVLEKVDEAVVAKLSVIIVGRVHPLTIKLILSKTNAIAAILSNYDGLSSDSTTSGRLGNTFIEFNPGDEGATIRLLFGRTGERSIVITHSAYRTMDDTIPPKKAIQRRIDSLYQSSEYKKAIGSYKVQSIKPNTMENNSPTSPRYVGTETCKTCHNKEYAQWRSTAHSSAIKTLIDRRRNYNPNCIACHVTGFEKAGGYSMERRQREMENVGCEVCHGPGEAHTKSGGSTALSSTPSLDTCTECHTIEHSAFEERRSMYWKRILHASK